MDNPGLAGAFPIWFFFIHQISRTGFVFEFKQCDSDPQSLAEEALQQIRERDYAAELREAGAKPIRAFGVAMCGKQVAVATELL